MNRMLAYEEVLHSPAAQKLIALRDESEWPELPKRFKPLDFPLSTLPPIGRDMINAVSEALQVHPDMPACFLLDSVDTR